MIHQRKFKLSLFAICVAILTYCFIIYKSGNRVKINDIFAVPMAIKFEEQDRSDSNKDPQVKGRAPNIVLIVADDLGFNDVGYHNDHVITPTLNNLANAGVRLENYYVQPICSPTRSQLMSGRYQIHTGLQHGIIKSTSTQGVPLDLPFMSEKLREAGYATHAVGKWHLGLAKRQFWPTYRGFDTFYGFLSGDQDHYTRISCQADDYCGRDFRNNTERVPRDSKEYSTNLFANKGKEIIEKHNTSKPLFLYLAFSAVHGPLQVPEKYEQLYKNIDNARRRTYLGMVTALDEAVANVTKSLKDNGLWENTVLVFTTDNGGCNNHGGSNYPLRKHKGSFFEGGIRAVGFVTSPLIPRRVRGSISRDLIHVTDWFPTFTSLAGIDHDRQTELDGFPQWDTLNGWQKSPRSEILINIDVRVGYGEPIFNDTFNSTIRAGLREGHWKLLTGQRPEAYGPNVDINSKTYKNVYLFNITNDPEENYDLSAKRPDVVKRLLNKLQDYHKTSVPQQNNELDPRSHPAKHGGFWDSWI